MNDLKERVRQFKSLQLPGQPMAMHMGTSYLVNDLWNEIKSLEERNKKLQFMVDNGLGEEDMKDDITYP